MVSLSGCEPKSYVLLAMQTVKWKEKSEKEKMPSIEDPAVPLVFQSSISNCHSLYKIH